MVERIRAAPVLALVFNAFVWGVSWWPFRILQAQGVHPLLSTAVVYLVALACVLAARPGAWRPFAREPGLWLLALCAGVTNVGFNWGVTIGDVVRVVLLFYLMPAWSVLLAWPLLGERPTVPGLLRVVLALTGVGIVLGGGTAGLPLPASLADWLGLLGGFSFALTNIFLRRLRQVPPAARVLAMFGGGAGMAAMTAAWALATGVAQVPAAPSTAAVAAAASLAVAFLASNLAMQFGASRLPAHVTALVMLSEVVFASVSAALLGAGTLSSGVLAGGLLILAAAAWSAWPQRPARTAAGAQSAA